MAASCRSIRALGKSRPSSRSFSERPVHILEVDTEEQTAELLVVEDALEDRLVIVHACHDVFKEALFKHQPELVQGVRASLFTEVGVRDHLSLELLQGQSILWGLKTRSESKWAMFSLFAALIVQLRNAFADRRDLLLENAALRQQRAAYQRRENRPLLTSTDRLFWVE